MRNENCFGHYIFEDIDCMLCEKCSACMIEKDKVKKDLYIKSLPDECQTCHDVIDCKWLPKECLGKRGKKKGVTKCSCSCKLHCIELSTNIKLFKCKKDVRCYEHNQYLFNSLSNLYKKGKTYKFYISCNEVYNEYLSKLFNNRDIFDKYFEEIK